MKHTKGPWKVEAEDLDSFGIFTDDLNICTVLAIGGEGFGEEGEANAKLIASSPELLEACKGAMAALSQNKIFPADIAAAKRFLYSVIAKAEGEVEHGNDHDSPFLPN